MLGASRIDLNQAVITVKRQFNGHFLSTEAGVVALILLEKTHHRLENMGFRRQNL